MDVQQTNLLEISSYIIEKSGGNETDCENEWHTGLNTGIKLIFIL